MGGLSSQIGRSLVEGTKGQADALENALRTVLNIFMDYVSKLLLAPVAGVTLK
jgi:hypothetical protein